MDYSPVVVLILGILVGIKFRDIQQGRRDRLIQEILIVAEMKLEKMHSAICQAEATLEKALEKQHEIPIKCISSRSNDFKC